MVFEGRLFRFLRNLPGWRRARKPVDGVSDEYRSRAEARFTPHGPRQITVATLGKQPGWDEQVPASGEQLDKLLDGQPRPPQLPLPDGTTPVAPAPATEPPEWRTLDVHGVRVERTREFVSDVAAVAHAGTVDEEHWTGQMRAAVGGRDRDDPILGSGVARAARRATGRTAPRTVAGPARLVAEWLTRLGIPRPCAVGRLKM